MPLLLEHTVCWQHKQQAAIFATATAAAAAAATL
jgi:hypothetical protein